MNKIVFLVIAVFAIGCNPKNDAWQLNLPAHFNTRYPADLVAKLPDSVRDKSETRAFLFEENEVRAFLVIPLPVEEDYPYILTVDNKGKQLDRLTPFENPEDRTEGASEDVTIFPDKTIVAIDTTYAILVDENGNVDETMKAMSVTQKKFKISATGKIEKVEESGL